MFFIHFESPFASKNALFLKAAPTESQYKAFNCTLCAQLLKHINKTKHSS